MLFSLTLKRASWLVTLVGLVAFAGSFGALTIFAADWVAAVIPPFPKRSSRPSLPRIIAQFAMSVTVPSLTWHQNRENEQMRTTIDSMAGAMHVRQPRSAWWSATPILHMYELDAGRR